MHLDLYVFKPVLTHFTYAKYFAKSPHNPPCHSSIKILSLYFKGFFFNHKMLYVEFFFLLKSEKVLLRHLEDRNLGRREYDRITLGKKNLLGKLSLRQHSTLGLWF